MTRSVLDTNIVLVGVFTASKFDKFFFIKNNFFNEEEILDSSVFLPDASIVQTNEVVFNIQSQKIILSKVRTSKEEDLKLNSLMLKFTPFLEDSINAIGFNFKYLIIPNEPIAEITKKLFFNPENHLNNYFSGEDVRYGYYVSKDLNDSRVRLDIKPIQLQAELEKKMMDGLSFDFNFHIEKNVYKNLQDYDSYEDFAKTIINEYDKI